MSIELSLYIERRILKLLLFALELKRELPYSDSNYVLSNQIARTIRRLEEIYKKAKEAGRREEFVSVMREVKRGASDTKYWIRILKKSNASSQMVSELEEESLALIKIFSRIIERQN